MKTWEAILLPPQVLLNINHTHTYFHLPDPSVSTSTCGGLVKLLYSIPRNINMILTKH